VKGDRARNTPAKIIQEIVAPKFVNCNQYAVNLPLTLTFI
jgi:hypothetical protein